MISRIVGREADPVTVPSQVRTARLLLRSWQPGDAAVVGPVLDANWPRLSPWIPARVAQPAPLPDLTVRLAGFAASFSAGREWRYGIFSLADNAVLGELAMFSRSPTARVAWPAGDRVEIGYWLRGDVTGAGFASEAALAALGVATGVRHFGHAEIRCDARNVPSGAVARRLGFSLSETVVEPGDPPVNLQVWTKPLR